MEKWTPASRRPPQLDDGPFLAADFDVAMHGTGWVDLSPVTTKGFDKAARHNTTLKDELERLCRTFQTHDLSALAEALQATAKGVIRRGPRKEEIDSAIIARIKGMIQAGRDPNEVAKEVAKEMPGMSREAQLKRAHRETKKLVRYRSSVSFSHNVALAIWAVNEAARQLDPQIENGTLAQAEAEQRLPGLIAEIKSRAIAGWDE